MLLLFPSCKLCVPVFIVGVGVFQVDLLARATVGGHGRTPHTSIDTVVATSLLLCKLWTVKHTAHR